MQAGDLCYYKPFKDVLNTYVEEWKDSPTVQYTPKGNPRPPEKSVVNEWVRQSWKCIDEDLVLRGLQLSGLSGAVENTYMANHDVYGENVTDAWKEMKEAGQKALSQEDEQEDPNDETIILDTDSDDAGRED